MSLFSNALTKSREEIVKTAKSFLNEDWGEYNVVTNNCEHFATYCATDTMSSGQVIKGGIAVGTVCAVCALGALGGATNKYWRKEAPWNSGGGGSNPPWKPPAIPRYNGGDGSNPPWNSGGGGSNPPWNNDGGGSNPPWNSDGGGSNPPWNSDGGGSNPPWYSGGGGSAGSSRYNLDVYIELYKQRAAREFPIDPPTLMGSNGLVNFMMKLPPYSDFKFP